MQNIFLSIGGNIGNKQLIFEQTKGLIEKKMGTIQLESSIYESPPWGFKSENVFWNQVLKIESELSPEQLLEEIQSIENSFGRERNFQGYASRQMDIDVLFLDDLIIKTKELTIPHPFLHKRMFVLTPLVEIAPDFIQPDQ